jgi:hypothetical protein
MTRKDRKHAPVWLHASNEATDAGIDERAAEVCIAYCAGRDLTPRPPADELLIPFDLRTNRAHCTMLCKQGIIAPEQLSVVILALYRIERDHRRGVVRLVRACGVVRV